MAEGYEDFLAFDWKDGRWQSYLKGLDHEPDKRELKDLKKKWYKRNVDPDFDVNFEPERSAPSRPKGESKPPAPLMDLSSGLLWAKMGQKGTICFFVHAASMTVAIAAAAGVFMPTQALILLISGFLLEILAKYGIRFDRSFVQSVLLDDVGMTPFAAVALLLPRMHRTLRLLTLVPVFLTCLLSFSQICKHNPKLPVFIKDFFEPLAELKGRYQLMQLRAYLELLLGFVLIWSVFRLWVAPLGAVLFWNYQMLRYITSPSTQAAFRNLDGFLSALLGNVPGVSHLYSALKRTLFSFVDPGGRRPGSFCSIL